MAAYMSPAKVRTVRALAAFVDVIQFGLFPAFLEGFLSPVNVAVDILMAVIFTAMIGWHWALMPAFVSELVPFVDLVPTWTIAVFIATQGRQGPEGPGGSVVDTTAEVVEPAAQRRSPTDPSR